ncbi:LOW QUALITY PROTEIN: hypothetical protein TorRG33x02_346980 [Trema orientale]|uniref:Uncharacterized protein n=1 Tax=Trema orientale TaxID=63057 RepID=A0A2P5AM96_TREOI|nr:LOW QUALITY PROTEIN: hypothetical protein TorRG33x02_346980 [Trema orientale]
MLYNQRCGAQGSQSFSRTLSTAALSSILLKHCGAAKTVSWHYRFVTFGSLFSAATLCNQRCGAGTCSGTFWPVLTLPRGYKKDLLGIRKGDLGYVFEGFCSSFQGTREKEQEHVKRISSLKKKSSSSFPFCSFNDCC